MQRLIRNLAIISILIVACNKRESGSTKADYRIQVDLATSLDQLEIKHFFASSHSIQLETNSESIFSEVSKIYIHENKMYVLAKHHSPGVFVFSLDGRFVSKIGQFGNGPGELSMLSDFSIDRKKNKILLLDMVKNKVFHFSLDGAFLNSVDLPLSSFGFEYIKDKYYLFPAKISDLENGSYVHIWKPDSVHNEYFGYKNNRNGNFSLSHRTSIYKENLSFWEPFNDTIYHMDSNLQKAKTFVDFGNKKIASKVFDMNLTDKIKYMEEEHERGFCVFLNDIIDNEQFIYFTFSTSENTILDTKYNVFYIKNKNNTIISKNLKLPNGNIVQDLFGMANDQYAYSVMKHNIDETGKESLSEKNPIIVLHKLP